MAKRFTDTDKWKKQWFRKLSNDNKVFWMYLLDQCDHAGIWEVDFDLASYFCNGINEDEIRNIFEKQYVEFDNGKRWFIKDFISFQYNELNPNVNAHKSVIIRLNKFNLLNNEVSLHEQLINPSLRVKDKDKDKDKVKDKEKGKKVQLESIKNELDEFRAKFPNVDVENEFDGFVDYLDQHGKRYKDYKAAFRNRLRSKWAKPLENTTLKKIQLRCPKHNDITIVTEKGTIKFCPECRLPMKTDSELALERVMA